MMLFATFIGFLIGWGLGGWYGWTRGVEEGMEVRRQLNEPEASA